VKSIRTGIEAASVAAKMRRLNLKQQNDDNREVAELRLSAVLELLEDASYVLQEEPVIVKRLRLEVVVRQIQQTTTSEIEISAGSFICSSRRQPCEAAKAG